MKLSESEQESIVGLMSRIYQDICDIEKEYQLLIGDGDFRPRIEHFHDAIRAITTGDECHYEDGGRLTVERLNYDLECLRYIQNMPLSPFTAKGGMESPQKDIVALDHKPVEQAKRLNRKTKENLVELYQHYAVLFAAILKPQADEDYHVRSDELTHDIKDIESIINQLENGNLDINQHIQNLEDDSLRHALIAFLQHEHVQEAGQIKKMILALKNHISKKDKRLNVLDKAHMGYVLSQLALFENSSDMLKRMAAKGMNLVGDFVKASMAEAQRHMDR